MMAAGLPWPWRARDAVPQGTPRRGALVADAQKSGRSLKAVAAETLAAVSPRSPRLDVLFDPLEP